MKKYIIFISLFFITFADFSQINNSGIPFITNYSPVEYGASEQNWAIIQDQRGVMYFGNNDDGILEYDGVKWRKIPISNNSIVRSMAIDSSGVIYVGAVDEIGMLAVNNFGQLKYKSLVPLIDAADRKFSNVWKTYTFNNKIYFCSQYRIFIYNNDSIKSIKLPQGSFFSFAVNNAIYVGNFLEGLYMLKNDKLIPIKNGNFFEKKGIFTLNKQQNGWVVGCFPQGLYVIEKDGNLNTKKLSNSAANLFLKTNQLYQGTTLNSNQIVYATIFNGAIIANENGEIINLFTKNNGLQNETVTYTYKANQLWLALNNGISKVEIDNPIRHFGEQSGLFGSVNDIVTFNNKLFVATSLGVFYLDFDKNNLPQFIQIKGIEDQTWSLLKYNDKLLIGTIKGLFQLNPDFSLTALDKQIRKNNEPDQVTYITKLFKYKNQVIVGKVNGAIIIRNINGKWQRYPLLNKNEEIRSIRIDNNNNIWLGTYFNGVYKLKIQNQDTTLCHYTNKNGFPDNKDIFINKINNELLFGTSNGLYRYNNSQDTFIFVGDKFYSTNNGVFRISSNKSGNIWTSEFNKTNKWVTIYNKNNVEKLTRLPNVQTDVIYHKTDSITWLGTSNGIYSYTLSSDKKQTHPFNTIIRQVNIGDSVLFYGTNFYTNKNTVSNQLNINKNTVLAYHTNDIDFQFAAPFFVEESKTLYSYKLAGYKENWNNWTSETKAVFTNLHEGKYTFMVKAKNIYGNVSNVTSYEFTIKPPWYRTILAYFIYAILGIVLIYIIVKLYTRRLEQEKIRLEGIVRERTAEIREQKEEIEQQAENLRKANVTLQEQKEEISKQKEEITASIKYAQRIQRAVVPNEDTAQCLLKNYFLLWRPRDIVSGDFWWLAEKNKQIIVAAADCTGHGVPGAFMSMLGVSFLNEIVNQQETTESHLILNRLRHKVKTTLGQTGKEGEAKDGMDIALLVIDFEKQTVQFSGAYNPLLLIRNGELITHKADRNPIGIYIKEKESFTQNIIKLQKNDTLYIFSDGYIDQFGGPNKMKFTSKRFKKLLLDIQEKHMPDQKKILNSEIDKWRGDTEQIDDIIVLGIRI